MPEASTMQIGAGEVCDAAGGGGEIILRKWKAVTDRVSYSRKLYLEKQDRSSRIMQCVVLIFSHY